MGALHSLARCGIQGSVAAAQCQGVCQPGAPLSDRLRRHIVFRPQHRRRQHGYGAPMIRRIVFGTTDY
jgi:hypothetical protein